MPVTPTYPGVYIEEVPSGVRTITGVATSITAFIGRAPRGPDNDPILIANFGDFERRFGGLNVEYALSYAVRDFYLNGGSQALIIRIDNGGAPSTIDAGGLALVAASPGTWGDRLRVQVTVPDTITAGELADQYGVPAASFFNLRINEDRPNGLIEEIRTLTVVESRRRVDRVLEQESSLVRVARRSWDQAVK